ncbi:MAG: hypothetical protein KKC71_10985 [Chloroflexi bacterium]|nr:hypothetical protein [Chloroflexota bacterium]
MREVKYRRFLDNANILRISFALERGQVLSFVVQLECYFEGTGWIPIVRYDTAHGFARRDKMQPHRDTEKMELAVRDYKEGLTFAIEDLETNWHEYRRRYAE